MTYAIILYTRLLPERKAGMAARDAIMEGRKDG